MAHEYPGGIARLADEMGKGTQVLTNKLNVNSETHHLTIAELQMLADFTGRNIDLADFFAQNCGAVVVQLPTDEAIGDMALLDTNLAAQHAEGELAASFRKSWEDGNISEREADEYERLTYVLIRCHLEKLAKVKALVR
jgi:hypothetical protein